MSGRKAMSLVRALVPVFLLLQQSLSQVTVEDVIAVTRGSAHLPCDIRPPMGNDSVLLVVWYKNDVRPIYSLDSRSKVTENGAHWKEPDVLGERAYFRTVTEPATLSLDNVSETDEAVYRCRVDFKTSPTRNHKVRLTVIVPPQKPTIFDDRGREVPSIAGPYEEGMEIKLTCIVSGGRPEPWVRWWRGETLVDSTDMSTGFPNVKNNQLIIGPLNRTHLHAIYTCTASNNNISQPVSARVTLEMHLKPMSVSILSSLQPLSAGRTYELTCQSIGSRPSAKISWWRDNKLLTAAIEKASDDGNITTSTLTLKPAIGDNGGRLTCRADNPRLQGGAQEDTWKLDIFYVPRLKLELGSKMNPEDIEEGDDVYFECKINANPSAYKVIWKHNNQIVQHNQKAGIIVSHKALALQGAKRQQAGNYTCVASNVEGDGDSNTVQLKVMYRPVCRGDQKHIFGVARNEDARVLCEVDAFPAPDDFRWSFNNSAETIDIIPSRFHNSLQLSLSTLSYTPQNEMDYGTVMCWASNSAGQQRDPCVFHIIAAGRPDPPYNCSVTNQTSHSLIIACIDGFDGGQPQQFQLEIFDIRTKFLMLNRTSLVPTFNAEGLLPGLYLKIIVYGHNSKGRSDPVIIEGYTLKVAEKLTGTPVPFGVTPIVVILVVAGVVLITCAVVIIGALKFRAEAAKTGTRPNTLTFKEKIKNPLRINTDVFETDDNNPDLIPCNKDSDYQLVISVDQAGAATHNTSDNPGSALAVFQETKIISANGDMYENYKTSCHPAQYQMREVSYAESCLGSGYGNDGKAVHTLQHTLDMNLMTCDIDCTTGCLSPTGMPGQREVITVRTPLMSNHQESCV